MFACFIPYGLVRSSEGSGWGSDFLGLSYRPGRKNYDRSSSTILRVVIVNHNRRYCIDVSELAGL